MILLDYVMTLVANTPDRARHWKRGQDYRNWIAREEYREWLVDLIRERYVILITARADKYREPTLARVQEVLDWLPAEAHFNEWGVTPPQAKERVMRRRVFPRHGKPNKCRYLALESNAATRAMYKRLGVKAVRVPTEGVWVVLPNVPVVT